MNIQPIGSADEIAFDAIDRKLAADITRAVVRTAVSDGLLDPRGKTDIEFRKEAIRYIRAAIQHEGRQFQFVTDFRGSLLKEARVLFKKDRIEESILYYATWMEHTLNLMAASIVRRRDFSQEFVKQFIAGMNPTAKYLFIVIQFTTKKPNQAQLAALQDLASLRNGFVHFKWAYHDEDTQEQQSNKLARMPAKAEKLVRHLRHFERKYLHFGLKDIARHK